MTHMIQGVIAWHGFAATAAATGVAVACSLDAACSKGSRRLRPYGSASYHQWRARLPTTARDEFDMVGLDWHRGNKGWLEEADQ